MLPSISIIIPTYNRSKTLPEAIKSVVEQAMGSWELIIIDDGSSDETIHQIQEYLSNDSIKYFFQNNRGVSAARNRGIEESKGDYLIFLDSDDSFLPGLFSRLNSLELTNYDLVFWQVKKIFPNHTEIWKAKKLEKIYNNMTATFLAGSVCYKKSIFKQSGQFDEELQFGENYELGMRISQIDGLKNQFLEEIFLVQNVKQIRENSIPSKKIHSLKHLLQKHHNLYLKDSFSHSRLLYQIGYLSEKLEQKDDAKKYYKKSWIIRPGYFKPFLRYLNLQRKILAG